MPIRALMVALMLATAISLGLIAYQLGNLITSRNSVFQVKLQERFHSYSPVLLGTVVVVALVLAGVTALGRESRGVELEAV